ncbi:hypothetical protein EK21DRAFT_90290 [Setomelanomma holmii]|uniref:Uncharacterized protein n=1 Tax=Setomelanomma holmii TaxID=210430 RepID=A0A9P4H776_9PLEO|nr:hypothetical protein EK21DRAFT_90290 [Setomelanomma holmii]
MPHQRPLSGRGAPFGSSLIAGVHHVMRNFSGDALPEISWTRQPREESISATHGRFTCTCQPLQMRSVQQRPGLAPWLGVPRLLIWQPGITLRTSCTSGAQTADTESASDEPQASPSTGERLCTPNGTLSRVCCHSSTRMRQWPCTRRLAQE